MASVAPPWFESLFKLGAADNVDVLSVHPYYVLPEVVESSLPELQCLISQYAKTNKEIWATEYGWDSADVERARYPIARYAGLRCIGGGAPHATHISRSLSYLVRQTLVQGLYGVTRHFWYDMVDDRWQKFGLLRYPAAVPSLRRKVNCLIM